MLKREYQPITIDPNRLLIGISSVSVNGDDLGALSESSIEVISTTKDRYVGYPANRHETIAESVAARVTLTAEEIGSVPVLLLLSNLFGDLIEQGTLPYEIVMLAPFAGGDNLQLTTHAKLIPEITLNWNDDWSRITFKFECLGTNVQTLLVKSIKVGARQPATTSNLNATDPIDRSKFKFGVGKPLVEIAGASVGAIQSVVLNIQGTTKKVEVGYPKVTSDIIYLESKFDISLVTEENALTPMSDCTVSLTQAIVDGGFVRLEFEHCTILEDMTLNAQNDWSGRGYKIAPFQLDKESIIKLTRG